MKKNKDNPYNGILKFEDSNPTLKEVEITKVEIKYKSANELKGYSKDRDASSRLQEYILNGLGIDYSKELSLSMPIIDEKTIKEVKKVLGYYCKEHKQYCNDFKCLSCLIKLPYKVHEKTFLTYTLRSQRT